MTPAGLADATAQIIKAVAATYQRQGFHQIALPAAELISVAGSRQQLEPALAALLDDGGLVPVGTNGVTLHPNARAALLTQAVLTAWHDRIGREPLPKQSLYRDGICRELATLVAWVRNAADAPPVLRQRAAELAGVLATDELDPRAMQIVASHGGTPASRLEALASLRPRSTPLDRLRSHLRHTVSSAYPG